MGVTTSSTTPAGAAALTITGTNGKISTRSSTSQSHPPDLHRLGLDALGERLHFGGVALDDVAQDAVY